MPYADQAQLNDLATHLHDRREAVLTRWRAALKQDPELTTPTVLPRAALDDHIPEILRNYERRLRAEHSLRAMEVDLEQRRNAAQHAASRWERGYEIRETVREWGHLQLVVQRELDHYAETHPQASPGAMAKARELLTMLCMEGISESAARYLRLLQAEATDRYEDLAQSLGMLQALEQERAVVLRHAAHDLRGSVGVISNASAVLARSDVEEPDRGRFMDMLQRGIGDLGSQLTDLMDLARLEAGNDPARLEAFDAAVRLRESCELLRPLALECNLFLKCEGPESLPVEGDPLKLHRILQNLVLNAIKATTEGGIVVAWKALEGSQWALSVRDSGRGLGADPGASAAAPLPAAPHLLGMSEGIGLSIVKRLCTLLDARVRIDSTAGQGTTFTVTLPRRYSATTNGAQNPREGA